MKTYIVDIDNTTFTACGGDYFKAEPIQARIEVINELYRNGNKVIYWTARGAQSGIDWTEFTYKQLESAGCLYSGIRMGKPHYDVWIDDKAVNSEDYFG